MSKKMHKYIRPQNEIRITQKLLDEKATNRVGKQEPKYIVIHEVSLGTGRSPKSFNMDHYVNKITESGKNGSTIGYHYLVGDDRVYQFIEDDIATEHTGTKFGNHNSIGIERVICEGGKLRTCYS